MQNSGYKKVLNLVALCLIPALLIAIGFLFQSERGFYFMYSVDPEYCYLFNGLNLAQFTLKVWHVDHPGTPIQFLAAIVIRVVHLFHSKEPLLQDVMRNSWLYAKAINITIFSLIGIMLFLLGYVAKKYTKNLLTSIFFQLIPFATYLTLSLILRINTEHVMIFSVVVFCIFFVKYLNDDTTKEKLIDKYLLWTSVIMGFTFAVKITFLPFFFVPLFLFIGLKKKILYGAFSLVSFLIFITPVLYYRHTYFFQWIKGLFLHSGKYGSGAANIIDRAEYMNALKGSFSFSFEPVFTITFFLIIAGCLIYLIPAVKNKVRNKKYYYALLGIGLSMVVEVLLIAKQFVYHYLTPALLLIVPGIYILVSIYFKNLNNSIRNIIYLVLICVILYPSLKTVHDYHPGNIGRTKELYKAYDYIKDHPTKNKTLIVPFYYGCPYQEYSLFFAIYWGGEIMKPRYVDVLKKMYPDIYFYHGWDELYHDWWGNSYTYIYLLKANKNIRLYMGDGEVENNIMDYVINNFMRKEDTKMTKVFSNDKTNEVIYEVSYNPPDTGKHSLEIICNADSINPDKNYFVCDKDQHFTHGETQSSDYSHSGKFSSKITKESPYGMTYVIGEVRKDEHYEFSVWRHISNTSARLVVSARSSNDLYLTEINSVKKEKDWEQLVINFIVPESMNNKEIRIYPFNQTDSPAYFDDLKIRKLP